MSANCLAGKVAIVTGSSSGIGLATAAKLASLGAKVTISGRNPDGMNDAKKSCLAKGAKESDILSVIGEITDENTRQKLIAETIKQFGRIDILVNNAGTMPHSSVLDGTATLQTLDFVFDTNMRALVDLTTKAVPHLIKTKGNVINISSIAGTKNFSGFMFYSMSKAAVDMFSRCLAQELGPQGVRVNIVSPGPVKTNLLASTGMSKEAMKQLLESEEIKNRTALERIGESSEIANMIAFLASDECANNITGANFVSDGGLLVK